MKYLLLSLAIFTSTFAIATEDAGEFAQENSAFNYWLQSKDQINSESIYINEFKNYADLAFYAVQHLVDTKQNEFQSFRTANYQYGREVPVSEKEMNIDNLGTKYRVLGNGYNFIHKGAAADNRRLIAELRFGYRDGEYFDWIVIHYKKADKDLANEFKTEVLRYLVEKNIYNHRPIEFKPQGWRNFRIHFMNNIAGLKLAWDDIILSSKLKTRAKSHTIDFLSNFDQFRNSGIKSKRGLIMTGPPGTGKSFLGQILISQVLHGSFRDKVSFISVSARHLAKYGDTPERIFQVAKALAPAVIFMEDMDLLGTKNREQGLSVYEAAKQGRTLNELLNNMDGIVDHDGLLMIGTTNRPENVDPALLRSKRLGLHLHFGLPKVTERKQFFSRFGKKKAVWNPSVDLEWLVDESEGMSGADIIEIISLAKLRAFETNSWSNDKLLLTKSLFAEAFDLFRNGHSESSEDGEQDLSLSAAFMNLHSVESDL